MVGSGAVLIEGVIQSLLVRTRDSSSVQQEVQGAPSADVPMPDAEPVPAPAPAPEAELDEDDAPDEMLSKLAHEMKQREAEWAEKEKNMLALTAHHDHQVHQGMNVSYLNKKASMDLGEVGPQPSEVGYQGPPGGAAPLPRPLPAPSSCRSAESEVTRAWACSKLCSTIVTVTAVFIITVLTYHSDVFTVF